ncbi:hypothetical protein [Roseivirga sp. E12]|uniref:hypothetical protein n=1 Tax=Roseivirga sp. E12 TaxID=2819237 RepID=UPI001ABD39B4|nr:hypothetical protein [Roseivirga sp. E12]MBO3700175.1 hypothetical protein [Roseivirga sp. E12]
MKKVFLFTLISACLFTGCDATDDVSTEVGAVAMYIVDYSSNELQFGATLNVAKVSSTLTSLPVSASITQPTNDLNGAVSLVLNTTGDQLFDGELSEQGTSRIFTPVLLSPNDFFELESPVGYPSQLSVLDIEGPYNLSFETLWQAIDHLSLTQIFLNQGGLFGRYLYQPSPNVSEQWKWVIIMYVP